MSFVFLLWHFDLLLKTNVSNDKLIQADLKNPPPIFLCHWKPARMTMAGGSLLPELHYTALQTPSGCYSVEVPLNSWFSCWVIFVMRRYIAFGRQSPVRGYLRLGVPFILLKWGFRRAWCVWSQTQRSLHPAILPPCGWHLPHALRKPFLTYPVGIHLGRGRKDRSKAATLIKDASRKSYTFHLHPFRWNVITSPHIAVVESGK